MAAVSTLTGDTSPAPGDGTLRLVPDKADYTAQ